MAPGRAPTTNRLILAWAAALLSILVVLAGCGRNAPSTISDHPRITPKVTLRDVTFRSAALHREMSYRVVMPASIQNGSRLPVVYLLHGGNGGFRDWTNYSEVARFAEHYLILVMPEGDESYYTNFREHAQDRYEDYIVIDLISDVGTRFPAASGRQNRAIAGISMGGFGAVKLALKHPDLFAFAGGLSPHSMCRAVHFRYIESDSGGVTHLSSGLGEAPPDGRTIHLSWLAPPTQTRCHTFFSLAATKRVCFQRIAVFRSCCGSVDFNMSFTLFRVVTTGINGMRNWTTCFIVWNCI